MHCGLFIAVRKPGYINLALALVLLPLAVILFFSRSGPNALDSELTFDTEFHNSLWNLDRAKTQWVEEKNKTEHALPTMADLTPYLGDWTNRIKQLVALGINYKITPFEETSPQSDVATLTRDLCFRAGFCRFYPAGTSYCLHTGWTYPKLDGTTKFRAFYINNQYLIAGVLFVLGVGSLLVFVIKKIWRAKLSGHDVSK